MAERVVTLGEIMLRLKPPGVERFFQSPLLEATFGGGEANVALSLANFGMESAFVSALPNNHVADACLRYLRGYGVDTSNVVRQGDRIGIYFLETGANHRPSNVVYDRANSSISTARIEDFDWATIFEQAGWLHITGIMPAISASAAEVTLHAVRLARAQDITISCDYSFRKKLWNYGRTAPEVMGELFKSIDVAIAGEDDCRQLIVSQGEPVASDQSAVFTPEYFDALAQKMFDKFTNLKYLATTLRESHSASHNGWSAYLYNGRETMLSSEYDISNIIDRIGVGDSFAAGLIYGIHTGMADQETLNFAVAASCLKYSIVGDANLATVSEVERLVDGDVSGRVQR